MVLLLVVVVVVVVAVVVVVVGGAVVVVGATVVVVAVALVLVGARSVVGVPGSVAGSPGVVVVRPVGTSPALLVDVGGAARSRPTSPHERRRVPRRWRPRQDDRDAAAPRWRHRRWSTAAYHGTRRGTRRRAELGRRRRAAVGDAREPASRCWSSASWARSSPSQPIEASGGSLALPWTPVGWRPGPLRVPGCRMVVGIVWFDASLPRSHRLCGPAPAPIGRVDRLQAAHLVHVPFENLHVFYPCWGPAPGPVVVPQDRRTAVGAAGASS